MGYQRDQSFSGATHRPGATRPGQPPPLPPRAVPSLLSPGSPDPPPYEPSAPIYHSQPLSHSWSNQDPRARSTESLVPSGDGADGRRTLLLVFIHGFMGNETSFQSFPAHIHNLVTSKLSNTHVVHTKIYPRYKSRKAIEYARDDFSEWLFPNESTNTDVILLGHSMGGILSAEVALLAPLSVADSRTYRHSILGTIDFDTPFLGMHPGVIVSGIGSLFQRKPDSSNLMPQDAARGESALLPVPQTPSGTLANGGLLPLETSTSLASSAASGYFGTTTEQQPGSPSSIVSQNPLSPIATSINDPNYDPPFPNDVRLPVRKGWDSTLHFIMKHSDGLTKATKSYVSSHLEFGGAMADYKGLKIRYEKLRALEDIKEDEEDHLNEYRPPKRVRFVNYYTASTGRIQAPKTPPTQEGLQERHQGDGTDSELEQNMENMSLKANSTKTVSTRSGSRSPRISLENPEGEVVTDASLENDFQPGFDGTSSDGSAEMRHLEPGPASDSEEPQEYNTEENTSAPLTESYVSTLASPIMDNSTVNSSPDLLSPSHSITTSTASSLPPIPSLPTPPSSFDPTPYVDKDARKLAEKSHARQMKTYQRAVKDRDSAIKDRRKMLEKRDKAARQVREKAVKDEEKQRLKEENEELKKAKETQKTKGMLEANRQDTEAEQRQLEARQRQQEADQRQAEADQRSTPATVDAPPAPTPHPPSSSSAATQPTIAKPKADKPKRDRKFCLLPARNATGERDPCWARVFMVGVDEVGAHCGLFVAGKPHYEALVLDVGGRVVGWVRERNG